MNEYQKEVRRIREAISSIPSIFTPSIIKTEYIDPELAEIGIRRLNFPWYTGQYPEIY